MTERKRAELKPLSANAFKNIGWALGFLFSVLFPKLTAPMKLTMPFDIAATIAAMFGFIVTFSVFKQASLSVGKKLGNRWSRDRGRAWYMGVVPSAAPFARERHAQPWNRNPRICSLYGCLFLLFYRPCDGVQGRWAVFVSIFWEKPRCRRMIVACVIGIA